MNAVKYFTQILRPDDKILQSKEIIQYKENIEFELENQFTFKKNDTNIFLAKLYNIRKTNNTLRKKSITQKIAFNFILSFSIFIVVFFLLQLRPKQKTIYISKVTNSDNIYINKTPFKATDNKFKYPTTIETKNTGILFFTEKNKTIYLYANSIIILKKRNKFILKKGKIAGKLFHSDNKKKEPLLIFTSDIRIKVLGTKFFIRKTEKNTKISVQKGHIQVNKNNQMYDIRDNATAIISKKKIKTFPTQTTSEISKFYTLKLPTIEEFLNSKTMTHKIIKSKLNSTPQISFRTNTINIIPDPNKNIVAAKWGNEFYSVSFITDKEYYNVSYQITNSYGEVGIYFINNSIITQLNSINCKTGDKISFTVQGVPTDHQLFLYILEKNMTEWKNTKFKIKWQKNNWAIITFHNTPQNWENINTTSQRPQCQLFNKLTAMSLIIAGSKMPTKRVFKLKNIQILTSKPY